MNVGVVSAMLYIGLLQDTRKNGEAASNFIHVHDLFIVKK